MKTSLIIRDDLLKEAMRVTGEKEKTAVIHRGLEELINAAARMRLIALGGRMPKASSGRRRRGKE